jgi:hypothetical protein
MVANEYSTNIYVEKATTFVLKDRPISPFAHSKTINNMTLFSVLKLQYSRLQQSITHKILNERR